MKVIRYCTVKSPQAEKTSRICTFKDCQCHSRWVCQECVFEEIHKHDQLNNGHLMKDQEFSKFIDGQQIKYQEGIKPIQKYIQYCITQLKDIVRINLAMIKELQFIQNLVCDKRVIMNFQKSINTTNKDFFALDLKSVNEIFNDYKKIDQQKLESLSLVINQQRILLQTYDEKFSLLGDLRTEFQNQLSIKQQRYIQLQPQEKRCVLIGYQETGKTRLFNLICSQKEQCDLTTKGIAQSKSASGNGFHQQDTPGFGSQELTSLISIMAALTEGPIHRIIIVTQYNLRIDVLVQQIENAINVVSDYLQLITIIITHKDQCLRQSDEYFNKAQEMIKQRCKIQSVYFSGIDTKCEELCSFIDKAVLKDGQIISIQDQKFDKMMQSYIDNVLQQAVEEFQNYLEILNYLKSDQNRLQISINAQKFQDPAQQLNNFKSFLSLQNQQIQKGFEENHELLIMEINNNPIKAYYYHIVFKNQIKSSVVELIYMAKILLKYEDDEDPTQLETPEIKLIYEQFKVYKQKLIVQQQRDKKLLYDE